MGKDRDLFFSTVSNLIDFVDALPTKSESLEIEAETWDKFKEEYYKLIIFVYEGTDKSAKEISK